MTQNTSHAVMAQRHEAHDSLDDFPTPPWATRALFEHVIGPWPGHLGWDPACNRGYMVRPMEEYMLAVAASDVHDYGLRRRGFVKHDFLQPYLPDGIAATEWIISNPPFRLGEEFVFRALEVASHGVAMLVRTSFLEGVGRYTRLFSKRPPQIVAQFVERVPMVKGRLDGKASTATAYCWLVWSVPSPSASRTIWIPPCRKQLERAADYPTEDVAA